MPEIEAWRLRDWMWMVDEYYIGLLTVGVEWRLYLDNVWF